MRWQKRRDVDETEGEGWGVGVRREGWREACLDKALGPAFLLPPPSARFSVAESEGPEPQPAAGSPLPTPQLGRGKGSEAVSPLFLLGRGPSGRVWRGARLTRGPGPCEPKGVCLHAVVLPGCFSRLAFPCDGTEP